MELKIEKQKDFKKQGFENVFEFIKPNITYEKGITELSALPLEELKNIINYFKKLKLE